ncbi:hypothetical protein E8E12_009524 [Didymella heteroderae]|uniref:Uncharacterized protein n=1 Tax=Didymella heteroderae TaxID=1769908 RepID=A0A9P5C508_9PLEO|nr:hypothetical protein E8E12_009524 [Didymella heteroderae]
MADFEAEPPDGLPSTPPPAPLSELPRMPAPIEGETATDAEAELRSQPDEEEEDERHSRLDDEDELFDDGDDDPAHVITKLMAALKDEKRERARGNDEWRDFWREKRQEMYEQMAEIKRLSEKLELAEKQKDVPLEQAELDQKIKDKLEQAQMQKQEALEQQKAAYEARIKKQVALKKVAKQKHENALADAAKKNEELEKTLAATKKSNARIAADVELVVLDDVVKLKDLIKEFEDAKLQVQQILAAPSDPKQKSAWLDQQEKSRARQKRFDDFMDEFVRRLHTSQYTADGISRVKHWYADEKSRPKNLPAPPGQPRYTEQEALKIYEEGRTTGIYVRKQAECLLEDSDISDFWSEEEYSDAEELNFAAEDEQMLAEHEFSQQELEIPECEDVGQPEDWNEAEHEEFVRLVDAISEVGLLPLIRRAIKSEADSGSCLGTRYLEKSKEWTFNGLLTLCTVHKRVLVELTHGNLVLATQQEITYARDRWAEYDEWVDQNTPMNENWAAEAAVAAMEKETRRQRKKMTRTFDAEELLEAYAMCEKLKTYPGWSSNPKTKANMECIEEIIRRYKEELRQ